MNSSLVFLLGITLGYTLSNKMDWPNFMAGVAANIITLLAVSGKIPDL
jgi:hypothetical protein